LHNFGDIDRLGLKLLAAGEGQHALGQGSAALGCLDRVVDQLPELRVVGQVLARKVEVAKNEGVRLFV
jgi:hypothetical protein